MTSDDFLISREALLGGLPTRQASTLLFAIESRTASLMRQSRMAVAPIRIERSAEEDEERFLDALAAGREPDFVPTIQHLEQYAPQWALLISEDDARLYAATAHLLGEKYTFTLQNIPAIRKALHLDDSATQEVYQEHYKQPLHSIYAETLTWREQLQWAWAKLAGRLENLPPFWTAFALTVTETVGATILALPIALASIGVMGGLVLLILLGLVNVFTLAAQVEAITRNGNMRYGNTFLGRLVRDYLGGMGSTILNISLLLLLIFIIIAYYIGIATSLEDTTNIPASLWVIATFAAGVFFLKRESLNATIASAIVISAINIAIIVFLVIMALPHISTANLTYHDIPFLDRDSFDATIMELIFGVVLVAYFGHLSAGNAAKTVLRQDPGGKSLLWGNIAAMLLVIVLYSLWVFAIGGAVAPEVLRNTGGTALSPLTDVAGSVVRLPGSIFVVLGMGMASIHISISLANQVREWLPLPRQPDKHNPTAQSPLHFWVSIVPLILIAVLVEWLLWSGQESFTGILNVIGMITVPLIGGIFPILILAASRRKGDYIPETMVGWLGNPVVIGLVFLLFFAGVLLHGLVIWQAMIPRLLALATSAIILGMTASAFWQGAFRRRTVVEIRVDQVAGKHLNYSISMMGKPLPVEVEYQVGAETTVLQTAAGQIPNARKLNAIRFLLPEMPAQELKIWAHQVTVDTNSHSLPATLNLQQGEQLDCYEMENTKGQTILPISGNCPIRVEMIMKAPVQ